MIALWVALKGYLIGGAVSLIVSQAWRALRSKEQDYFARKVHDERLQATVAGLDDIVDSIVKELVHAASDGVITADERNALIASAVSRVCHYMTDHGLADLRELMRTSESVVIKFIETKVMAKLHDVQRPQAANLPALNTGIRLPPPTLS